MRPTAELSDDELVAAKFARTPAVFSTVAILEIVFEKGLGRDFGVSSWRRRPSLLQHRTGTRLGSSCAERKYEASRNAC